MSYQEPRQGGDSGAPYVRLVGATPPGWVGLELDVTVDARTWAARHVKTAAAGGPGSTWRARARASAELSFAVRCAREQPTAAVRLSYAFQPDALGPVLAVADASVLPVADAESLVDLVAEAATEPGILGDPEVDQVDLAWGPTVRVRRVMANHAAADAVVEQVTYLALPPGLGGVVGVHAQWRTVALGDELAARVYELVAQLHLTFRQ